MNTLSEHGRSHNFRLPPRQTVLPRLLAMTDETRQPDPFPLIGRLPSGSGLIFRHYGAPERARLAARVVGACQRRGVRCLIAGDARLALELEADGVHLAEWQLRRGAVYGLGPLRARRGLITAAAHSLKTALSAQRAGLHGVLVSPVFATKSHEGADHLGVLRLAHICRKLELPVIALGGVTGDDVRRLEQAGAYGIAGIGLFQTANHNHGGVRFSSLRTAPAEQYIS